MLDILARNWWALALRGVVAVLFGLAALIWPGLTLTALVLLFGAYSLVDGIFAVVSAFARAGRERGWWAFLVEGLLGIAAGIVTLLWPGITGLVLLLFIAAWAIVTGVVEIVAAIRLRREIEGEFLLGLSGVLSVIFGLILIARPGAGAVAVAWLIGAYALLFGALLLALAFRLRGLRGRGGVPSPA